MRIIKTRFRDVLEFALELKDNFLQNNGPLAAAAVAFFLMLSLVPLLLLLVSAASYFLDATSLEQRIEDIAIALGPGIGDALQEEILTVVRNRGLLTGLSLLFGLWAGSQIFIIIGNALNQIWGIKDTRSFLQRRALALLMVVVMGTIVGLTFLLISALRVLARLDLPATGNTLSDIPFFATAVFGYLIPIMAMTLVFAIIYRYLSARHVIWILAWVGAFIAAVLWVVALQGFSWYAAYIADYSVLYGSLGGLVLLMLWFNLGSQIFLGGAALVEVLHLRRERAGVTEELFDDTEAPSSPSAE